MEKENLVSVILPCYNAEPYIGYALQSVLQQTHRFLEIIIVNDGSIDQSADVIASYKDDRIKYYETQRLGQCGASNFGLLKSSGNYIKFFDADDLMNATHIELQLKRLQNTTNCIASCSWGRFYDGNPESARFIPETVWKDMKPLDWLKASLKQKYDMMGAWLWLIPRHIIQKAGGWDERLSLNNDFEFSIRLLLHAEQVLFVNDAKIFYRSGLQHALSQVRSRERYEAALLSTELGCDYLLKADNSEEMKEICANRYQEWLYRIYPHFPDLQKDLICKIKALGGSSREMDGGRVAKIFNAFLGWRTTKLIRLNLQRFGYRKLPFQFSSQKGKGMKKI